MARVRHPNLQGVNGHYLENATVTAVTDRTTEEEAEAFTTEEGGTPVTYPVSSGPEGNVDIWVAPGSYESTFGDDTVDEPAVWEAVVGVDSGQVVDAIAALEASAAAWEGPFIDAVIQHGATGDGTTDDTAAVQACFDDARINGGCAYLPFGDYRITETLYLTSPPPGDAQAENYRIMGELKGKSTTSNARGACLWYDPPTPVGAGPLIDYNNGSHIEMSHLGFRYTGDMDNYLIKMWGQGSSASVGNHIHDCSFSDTVVAPGSRSSLAQISLFCTIDTIIERCSIGGGDGAGIRFEGGLFNVTIAIRDNEFHNNGGPHIFLGTADAENIVIEGNTFEVSQSIKGGLIADGDPHNNNMRGLVIRNNWFGDGTGVDWIEGVRAQIDHPCIIMGNFFGAAGSTRTYLNLANGPWLVIGNGFGGTGSVYGESTADITSIGNVFSGGVNSLWISSPPTGVFRSLFDTGAVAGTATNRISSPLTFERKGGALNTTDPDVGNRALIIGDNSSGTPSATDCGLIYADTVGGNALVLQARSDVAASAVKLRGGTTPATKIEISGNGIGFFGTTPTTKPTGVAVDAAGIHAALVSLGLIAA